MLAFTGLESVKAFQTVCNTFQHLEKKINPTPCRLEMSLENRILLTLLKLKINCSFRCLSAFFNILPQSAAQYFYRTLKMMSKLFKHLIPWPSKDEIRKNLPIYFDEFKDARVVIDCTEFPVACCRCLLCRVRCYSHYKGTHTLKVILIIFYLLAIEK